MTSRVVLASGNTGKLSEIQSGLSALDWDLCPQSVWSIAAAEETGETYIENALIKARHAALQTGLPALADDSGLSVDVLSGRPGVRSARYAGAAATDAARIERLLSELKDVSPGQRQAAFHCVLVYLRDAADPRPVIAEGVWRGEILLSSRGESGFGYDPIFYVASHDCSAAELSMSEKAALSHRGQAMVELQRRLAAVLCLAV